MALTVPDAGDASVCCGRRRSRGGAAAPSPSNTMLYNDRWWRRRHFLPDSTTTSRLERDQVCAAQHGEQAGRWPSEDGMATCWVKAAVLCEPWHRRDTRWLQYYSPLPLSGGKHMHSGYPFKKISPCPPPHGKMTRKDFYLLLTGLIKAAFFSFQQFKTQPALQQVGSF